MPPVANQTNMMTSSMAIELSTVRLAEIADEHIKSIKRTGNLYVVEFTEESPLKGRICVNLENLTADEKIKLIRLKLAYVANQQDKVAQSCDIVTQGLHRLEQIFEGSTTHLMNQGSVTSSCIEEGESEIEVNEQENKGVFSTILAVFAWPFLKICELFGCIFCFYSHNV